MYAQADRIRPPFARSDAKTYAQAAPVVAVGQRPLQEPPRSPASTTASTNAGTFTPVPEARLATATRFSGARSATTHWPSAC